MTDAAALVPRGRPTWPTLMVLVGAAVVGLSFALSDVAPLMVLTTVAAVAGATAFVLGVSASISAFLDHDAYADSDFYR